MSDSVLRRDHVRNRSLCFLRQGQGQGQTQEFSDYLVYLAMDLMAVQTVAAREVAISKAADADSSSYPSRYCRSIPLKWQLVEPLFKQQPRLLWQILLRFATDR